MFSFPFSSPFSVLVTATKRASPLLPLSPFQEGRLSHLLQVLELARFQDSYLFCSFPFLACVGSSTLFSVRRTILLKFGFFHAAACRLLVANCRPCRAFYLSSRSDWTPLPLSYTVRRVLFRPFLLFAAPWPSSNSRESLSPESPFCPNTVTGCEIIPPPPLSPWRLFPALFA